MVAPSRSRAPTILTPDQRLRVFISSTLKEMEPERVATRRAIEGMRLAPVMFELGARPHPAQDLYRAYLEQSHVFVGIYGEQYGWVAPDMEISGLEDEYNLAAGKPKLIYIRADAPNRHPRLVGLLNRIRDHDSVSYKYFSTVDELRELVESDLTVMLAEVFAGSLRPDPAAGPEPQRAAPPTDLPLPLTPLLGREAQVEAACDAITRDRVRLLTLTGPGGGGKTRLALEVARALAGQFDEVWWVELAAVTDPQLVPSAIAETLGVREAGSRPVLERLEEHFRDRRALLVLDNFEQVTDASPAVATLLERAPRIAVLATSRRPLQIRGEVELPVPPLSVPDPDLHRTAASVASSPAVQLFAQRAAAVRPGFAVTDANATALAEICRRLDGSPLAIELAAARVRLLPPEAIRERLEQRMALLQGGARDLPERQRTIRNTIAWSYDLLREAEATLFRRLSVFSGDFALAAAKDVCDPDGALGVDVLDGLEALASQSLLRVHEDRGDGPRFELFETMREFAFEKLSATEELDTTLARHGAFFADLAERAEPYLRRGRGQRERWIATLQLEIANLRAVLGRSLERRIDPALGIRLAGSLGWFWHLGGHLSEGRRWAQTLSEQPEAQGRTRSRARVLFPAGGLAWSQGDYTAANALLEESADIFDQLGDLEGMTDARGILAGGLASLGDLERAARLCEDTVARLRGAGDEWGLAFTLLWLGSIVLVTSGDARAARGMFDEALAHARSVDDGWLCAEAHSHLGVAAGLLDEGEAVETYFAHSLAHHDAMGDRWGCARGLSGYGEVMLRRNDAAAAGPLFEKAMRTWRSMGNRLGLIACLGGLARVAAAAGDAERAARLFGATPEWVRPSGYLFLSVDPAEIEPAFRRARASAGEASWDAQAALGRAMTLDEAVSYALGEPAGAQVTP